MIRASRVAVTLLALGASSPALAQWTFNPTTGHWYRLTPSGLTWQQAEDWAVANGGHLITIDDGAEDAWAYSQYGTNGFVLWIGLYQLPGSPEPSGGWVWSSGYAVTYQNWAPSEPNNSANAEHVAQMVVSGNPNASFWNDYPSEPDPQFRGPGIVEREVDPAVPAVSTWGVVVMTLLTLSAGTAMLRGRRARVTS